MPSGDHAEGRAKRRARSTVKATEIMLNGGPQPPLGLNPGLDWFAKHLEPRRYADVADELVELGEAEALITSVAITGGGATMQLQILPAYTAIVVDMAQRSTQGVLMMRFSQVDFEAHRIDGDPAWDDDEPEDGSDGNGT